MTSIRNIFKLNTFLQHVRPHEGFCSFHMPDISSVYLSKCRPCEGPPSTNVIFKALESSFPFGCYLQGSPQHLSLSSASRITLTNPLYVSDYMQKNKQKTA